MNHAESPPPIATTVITAAVTTCDGRLLSHELEDNNITQTDPTGSQEHSLLSTVPSRTTALSGHTSSRGSIDALLQRVRDSLYSSHRELREQRRVTRQCMHRLHYTRRSFSACTAPEDSTAPASHTVLPVTPSFDSQQPDPSRILLLCNRNIAHCQSSVLCARAKHALARLWLQHMEQWYDEEVQDSFLSTLLHRLDAFQLRLDRLTRALRRRYTWVSFSRFPLCSARACSNSSSNRTANKTNSLQDCARKNVVVLNCASDDVTRRIESTGQDEQAWCPASLLFTRYLGYMFPTARYACEHVPPNQLNPYPVAAAGTADCAHVTDYKEDELKDDLHTACCEEHQSVVVCQSCAKDTVDERYRFVRQGRSLGEILYLVTHVVPETMNALGCYRITQKTMHECIGEGSTLFHTNACSSVVRSIDSSIMSEYTMTDDVMHASHYTDERCMSALQKWLIQHRHALYDTDRTESRYPRTRCLQPLGHGCRSDNPMCVENEQTCRDDDDDVWGQVELTEKLRWVMALDCFRAELSSVPSARAKQANLFPVAKYVRATALLAARVAAPLPRLPASTARKSDTCETIRDLIQLCLYALFDCWRYYTYLSNLDNDSDTRSEGAKRSGSANDADDECGTSVLNNIFCMRAERICDEYQLAAESCGVRSITASTPLCQTNNDVHDSDCTTATQTDCCLRRSHYRQVRMQLQKVQTQWEQYTHSVMTDASHGLIPYVLWWYSFGYLGEDVEQLNVLTVNTHRAKTARHVPAGVAHCVQTQQQLYNRARELFDRVTASFCAALRVHRDRAQISVPRYVHHINSCHTQYDEKLSVGNDTATAIDTSTKTSRAESNNYKRRRSEHSGTCEMDSPYAVMCGVDLARAECDCQHESPTQTPPNAQLSMSSAWLRWWTQVIDALCACGVYTGQDGFVRDSRTHSDGYRAHGTESSAYGVPGGEQSHVLVCENLRAHVMGESELRAGRMAVSRLFRHCPLLYCIARSQLCE